MYINNGIRSAVLFLLLGPLMIGPPAAGKKWKDDKIPMSNSSCNLAPTSVEPEAFGRAIEDAAAHVVVLQSADELLEHRCRVRLG